MTHTFAKLEVSPEAYDEIAAKLKDADYGHAFIGGVIDMHGIGLVKSDGIKEIRKLASAGEPLISIEPSTTQQEQST